MTFIQVVHTSHPPSICCEETYPEISFVINLQNVLLENLGIQYLLTSIIASGISALQVT
jgi:hypothetical protein